MPPEVASGAAVQSFLTPAFVAPILFVAANLIITRVNHFSLGYFLYRIMWIRDGQIERVARREDIDINVGGVH